MKYQNRASHYMQDGYEIPDFAGYAGARLQKLKAPMQAPCYAAGNEQERLNRLRTYVQENPYAWYEKNSNAAYQCIASYQAQNVTRSSDPLLYECVLNSCAALGVNKPTVFTYTHQGALRYNALALGYMEMTWVFVSSDFRKNGILSDLELTFVVGHELGHYAARHTAVCQTQNDVTKPEERSQELTADRAGFLAALWRVSCRYPSLSADQMVQKALESASSALHKLDVLIKASARQTFTPQTLKLQMEKNPVKKQHAKSNDTHPSTWERIEALEHFAISIHFVKCVHELWGKDHFIAQNYDGAGSLRKKLNDSVCR